jgi:carbon storage regulator
MLVLKRRPGQALLIGDGIEIQILESSANRVKLGIHAPDHVSVVRKEVALTREQNLSASRTVSPNVLDWLSQRVAAGPAPAGSQQADVVKGIPDDSGEISLNLL